uniref:Uncharacterized protein n=1 Tax=Tanacetum cinerariifolium TaxID=118510 RepID=A0A699GQE6_TANCI|nr:hypothetical protein [Tanacetum cinerariifolium]
MLDTQEITYTVDIFCDTLKLLVESLNNPFIVPVNIKVIESFMRKVSYQGVVAKVSAFFTKFLAPPWQTIFKKFPSIPQRLDEDYHSIKDDIPLVSFYSTRNVLFRGMPILDALLTNKIRATIDYTEYEMVFVKVAVLMNQLQPVVSTQGTHRTTPRAHGTHILTKAKTTSIPPPSNDRERDKISEATLLSLTLHKTALATEAQENVEKKLAEEEIENMVEGNLEVVDDDVTKKKDDKKNEDEEKDDDVEKMDDVVEEKDNDDHNNNTLVGIHAMGSMETRNE